MKELGADARRLIELAVDQDDPSPSDRARVRRALSAAVGTAAGLGGVTAATGALAAQISGAAAAGTTAGSATGASIGALKLASWLLMGAGLGLAVSIPAVQLGERFEANNPTRTAQRSLSAPPGVTRHVQAAGTGRASADSVSTPESSTPRNVRAAPEPTDSLAGESQLLSSAQRALASGDPERALSMLADHAARFPDGALAPERDAARVLALCASGNRVQARALADQFLARHSASPLAQRVRAACSE
jgi:hypothetical protein